MWEWGGKNILSFQVISFFSLIADVIVFFLKISPNSFSLWNFFVASVHFYFPLYSPYIPLYCSQYYYKIITGKPLWFVHTATHTRTVIVKGVILGCIHHLINHTFRAAGRHINCHKHTFWKKISAIFINSCNNDTFGTTLIRNVEGKSSRKLLWLWVIFESYLQHLNRFQCLFCRKYFCQLCLFMKHENWIPIVFKLSLKFSGQSKWKPP